MYKANTLILNYYETARGILFQEQLSMKLNFTHRNSGNVLRKRLILPGREFTEFPELFEKWKQTEIITSCKS